MIGCQCELRQLKLSPGTNAWKQRSDPEGRPDGAEVRQHAWDGECGREAGSSVEHAKVVKSVYQQWKM